MSDRCVQNRAEVVFLRRNIQEKFTYLIPSEYFDQDKKFSLLGKPVVVPLGSDLTVGLVVETFSPSDRDEVIESENLKSIEAPISSFGSLPEELLELGVWISDYCICPINRVFEAILPSKYLPEPVRGWGWKNDVKRENIPEMFQASLEQDPFLFEQVEAPSGCDTSKIRKQFNELRDRSIIEERIYFHDSDIRERKFHYLRVDATDQKLSNYKKNATKRQKELLDCIDRNEGIFQKDLPDYLRRTDLIKSLMKSSVIKRRKKQKVRDPYFSEADDQKSSNQFKLTTEQKKVLKNTRQDIKGSYFESHLIHGVTGSGKTEVYFRLAEYTLEREQSVLILVPEITLATFMVNQFRSRFGEKLAILHSGLSEGERHDEWKRIFRDDAQVVLGVQSAVLAPLNDLGLIVVDEEHDSSYKAGQSPRYNARDVAVMRAKINEIPVVLGSATPSIESYYNAKKEKYQLHKMKNRPLEAELPDIKINDLRGEERLLTDSVREKTRAVLGGDHKAIWFLNRRGFSNFLLCENCGSVKSCRQCNVSLTLHRDPKRLQCHYCGYTDSVPDRCQNCNQTELKSVGTGTEKLSDQAQQIFNDADIIRMDSDTVTRKRARYEKLKKFESPGGKLLIGTQMVTKGLDFENVDFVAVIHADTGLHFPDFRAGERTFQQIVQVCGRAGREKSTAEVCIQTYNPGHYAIQYGKNNEYLKFFKKELNNRNPLHYPPFSRLINIVARGENEQRVSSTLNELRSHLNCPEGVEVLGPSPCGIDYVEGEYRWHLLLRGSFNMKWRSSIKKSIIDFSCYEQITVDVDPINLM